MNTLMLEKIKRWSTQNLEGLLKIERLFQEELRKNPQDTSLWLRLSLVELSSPLADYDKAMECYDEILSYDLLNIDALIFKAFNYACMYGYYEKDTKLYHALQSVLSDNNEYNAMLEIAKAWHYDFDENFEAHMKKALTYCKNFPNPYIALANMYAIQGLMNEAAAMMKKALDNVKTIFYKDNSNDYNLFDVQEFYDYRITMISMNNFLYNHYEEEYKKYLSKI